MPYQQYGHAAWEMRSSLQGSKQASEYLNLTTECSRPVFYSKESDATAHQELHLLAVTIPEGDTIREYQKPGLPNASSWFPIKNPLGISSIEWHEQAVVKQG